MKKAEKQKVISDAVTNFSEALNSLNIAKGQLEYAGLNQSAKLLEHYMTRLRGIYDELYDRGTTFVESEEIPKNANFIPKKGQTDFLSD